jgi:hypothetical protein
VTDIGVVLQKGEGSKDGGLTTKKSLASLPNFHRLEGISVWVHNAPHG